MTRPLIKHCRRVPRFDDFLVLIFCHLTASVNAGEEGSNSEQFIGGKGNGQYQALQERMAKPVRMNDDMWKALRGVVAAPSFDRLAFERDHEIEMSRVGGNKFYDFYRGGPMRIGTIVVGGVDFRVNKKIASAGLISLAITSPCWLLSDIEKHYPAGSLTLAGGNSPNELVYYSVEQIWGNLRFGFHQTGTQCLVLIIMDST